MEFITIAVAHFLALLSPGSDFFLILQGSLRLPRRYGIAMAAGISLANGVYLTLTLFGLEFIKEFNLLTQTLKYCGAAYLLFLGICLLSTTKQGDKELSRCKWP